MKKIFITILSILLLSSCTINTKENNETSNETSNTWQTIKTKQAEKPKISKEEQARLESIKKIEERKKKIEIIRKKLTLRWLILKWDIHFKNWDYTSALVKYLQIYKQVPNDSGVINDIAKVYYNLKKFNKSYFYFSKIKDYDRLDKDLVAKALISSKELNSKNIDYILWELDTLWLSEEQLFYYKNSLRCKQDFSFCKQKFQDYFDEEIKTASWEIIERQINFSPLLDIKTALNNYKNSKLDDLSYKWALVSGVFFVNWLYPIAIETSKTILKDKKDYKPLLKIVAKSYYELWNYIQAKIYLIKYNKLVDDDYEASYFTGRIYEKLHDYVLSNIHFQKALKLWFPDKLDIQRRILLNYYELWETNRMLKIFTSIINDFPNQINENDYELAIYYHIVNNKLDEAKTITDKAIKKYPKSETFNWYMWWILLEQNNDDFKQAEEYINSWLKINTKDPMLNLVKAKLETKMWNLDKAFIYFKKTISLDKNWEFWKIAKIELDKIEVWNSKTDTTNQN